VWYSDQQAKVDRVTNCEMLSRELKFTRKLSAECGISDEVISTQLPLNRSSSFAWLDNFADVVGEQKSQALPAVVSIATQQ